MHDTAFKIGRLAMQIYSDLKSASILEIGAQAINGSLRDHAFPSTKYVGLDLAPGQGVDIVVEAGKAFPTEDNTFDLVLASSVFEHDPAFWLTFIEMCRTTKNGGYIYINAPSNGAIHRYPQDNWRFYPDAGKALSKWAVDQGHDVTLIESFTANREQDIWNDFVAVFRKGAAVGITPESFIHEQVSCTNVITWRSDELSLGTPESEDMVLIRQGRERSEQLEGQVHERDNQLAAIADQKTAAEADLASTIAQRDAAESQLAATIAEKNAADSAFALLRSDMEQRLSAETRKVEEERSHRSAAETEAEEWRRRSLGQFDIAERLQRTVDQLSERLMASQDAFVEAQRQLTQARIGAAKAQDAHDSVVAEASARESELTNKIAETEAARLQALAEVAEQDSVIDTLRTRIDQLSDQLGAASLETERLKQQQEWLSAVSSSLLHEPRWWSLLPKGWRAQREQKRLKRRGLFDGVSYLALNPDVAAAALEPIRHYIVHGIREERPRGI